MSFLKEPIGSAIYNKKYVDTYDEILSKINKLEIEVERYDEKKGEIVAHCLVKTFDVLLRRSWSEKLLFQVKEVGENRTKVDVFAIINLFRIKKGKKGQKAVDINEIKSVFRL